MSSSPSDKNNFRTYRTGYDLEHRFSENWQLRSAFRASFLQLDRNYILATGLLSDNRTLNRVYSVQDFRDDIYNLDSYVVGKLATGSIEHQLVVGFNLSRLDEVNDSVVGQAARLNVFNPVYGQPRGAITTRNDLKFRSDALGVYVQDLKLLLGGRFDIASQKRENLLAATTQFQQDEVFSLWSGEDWVGAEIGAGDSGTLTVSACEGKATSREKALAAISPRQKRYTITP